MIAPGGTTINLVKIGLASESGMTLDEPPQLFIEKHEAE